MKKKIALMLVCVFCLSFAFSGCNLFALDYNKYLNQTIATVKYKDGDTITITKEDLVQAYNRHGKDLLENNYTQATAVEYLVKYLVNQKVLLKEITNIIEESKTTTDPNFKKLTLDNSDYNTMWKNAYNSVINLVGDYEEDIIAEKHLETPTVLTEDTEDSNTYFKEYEKKAEIVWVPATETEQGHYVIKEFVDPKTEQPALSYTAIGTEISTLQTALTEKINTNDITKEAFDRYIDALKEYEKGRNLSKVDSEIFQREIERVYKDIVENYYLGLYSDYYQNTTGNSMITVNDILTFTEGKMEADYTKYTLDETLFKTDILSSRDGMWYVTKDNYFYVSHILFKFSDEQSNNLKNAKTLYENGTITYQAYLDYKAQLLSQIAVKDFGEDTDLTCEQFLAELNNALAGKTTTEKLAIFNDYMYRFNQDTGNKNAKYDYVIGTDDTKMVESFTNASRDLYNNGLGNTGDLSGLVESEYGYHIVFYLNPVENPFDIENINTFSLTDNANTNIEILANTKLSLLNTETWFDLAFEELSADKFSTFETMHISNLKKDLKITTLPNNYSEMIK